MFGLDVDLVMSKNDPTRDQTLTICVYENGNMISGITCFALVFMYVWFGS